MRAALARWRRRLRARRMPRSGWVNVQRQGLRWRLCMDHYLDRSLYQLGEWEPLTTRRLRDFLREGAVVVDVGANIGYFTLLAARLGGPKGHVFAFEPTREYGRRLADHVADNGLSDRVTLLDFGLSDRDESLEISIGNSSATSFPVRADDARAREPIRLRRLDDVAAELGIVHADLLKLDIDGAELRFLDGAERFLRELRPVVLVEFCQLVLRQAGSDVCELRDRFTSLGYTLYSETTGEPFGSEIEFLVECGNYRQSANVWAFPDERRPTRLPGSDAI